MHYPQSKFPVSNPAKHSKKVQRSPVPDLSCSPVGPSPAANRDFLSPQSLYSFEIEASQSREKSTSSLFKSSSQSKFVQDQDKKYMQEYIEVLKKRISSLSNSNTKILANDEKVYKLKLKCARLDDVLREKEENILALQDEVKAKNEEILDLVKKIDEVESNSGVLVQENEKLQMMKDRDDEVVIRLKLEKVDLMEKLSDLKRETTHLRAGGRNRQDDEDLNSNSSRKVKEHFDNKIREIEKKIINEIERLNSENEMIENRIELSQKTIRFLQNNSANEKSKNFALEKELQDKSERFSEIITSRSSIIEAQNEKISKLESKISELKNKHKPDDERIERVKEELFQANLTIDEHKTQFARKISEKDVKIETLLKQAEDLIGENKKLKEKIDKSDLFLLEKNKELLKLNIIIEELKREISEMNNTAKLKDDKIGDLSSDNKVMEIRILYLEDQLSDCSAEKQEIFKLVDEKEKIVNEAKESCLNLSRKLSEANITITKNKEKIKNLNNSIREKDKEIEKLAKHAEAYQDQMHKKTGKIELLEKKVKEMENYLNQEIFDFSKSKSEEIQFKDNQISALTENFEKLLNDKEILIKTLNRQLAESELELDCLKNTSLNLDNFDSLAKDQADRRIQEAEELIKENEKLKLICLENQEKIEQVATLNSSLKSAIEALELGKTESEEKTKKLENKKEELETYLEIIKLDFNSEKNEIEKEKSSLNKIIEEFEQEKKENDKLLKALSSEKDLLKGKIKDLELGKRGDKEMFEKEKRDLISLIEKQEVDKLSKEEVLIKLSADKNNLEKVVKENDSRFNREKELLLSKINGLESIQDKLETENKNKEEEIKKLKEEKYLVISNLQGVETNLRRDTEELAQENTNLREKLNSLESENSRKANLIDKITADNTRAEIEITEAKNKYNEDISGLQKKIDSLTGNLEKEKKGQLEALKKIQEKALDKKVKLESEKEELTNENAKLKEILGKAESEKARNEELIKQLEQEIKDVQSKHSQKDIEKSKSQLELITNLKHQFNQEVLDLKSGFNQREKELIAQVTQKEDVIKKKIKEIEQIKENFEMKERQIMNDHEASLNLLKISLESENARKLEEQEAIYKSEIEDLSLTQKELSNKLVKENTEEINELRNQIELISIRHNEEIETINKDFDETIGLLDIEHSNKIKEIEHLKEIEIEKLKIIKEKESKELIELTEKTKENYEKIFKEKDEKIRDLKEKNENTVRSFQQQTSKLELDHYESISKILKEKEDLLNASLNSQKIDYEEKLKILQKELETNQNDLRNQHREELDRLAENNRNLVEVWDSKLKSLESELKRRGELNKTEVAALQASHLKELEKAQESRASLLIKLNELERSKEVLEERYLGIAEKHEGLLSSITEKGQENEGLEEALRNIERQVELNSAIIAQLKESNKLIPVLESQISDLKLDLSSIQALKESLEAELQSVTHSRDQLEQENTRLEEVNKTQDLDFQVLKQSNSEQESKLSSILDKIMLRLHKSISLKAPNLKSFQDASKKNEYIHEIIERIEQQFTQFSKNSELVKEKDQKIKELNRSIVLLTQEIGSLKEQDKGSRKMIDSKTSEIEKLTIKSEESKEEIKNMLKTVKEQEEAIVSLKEKLASFEDLKESIESRSEDYKSIDSQLKSAQNRALSLETQTKQLEETHRQSEEKLKSELKNLTFLHSKLQKDSKATENQLKEALTKLSAAEGKLTEAFSQLSQVDQNKGADIRAELQSSIEKTQFLESELKKMHEQLESSSSFISKERLQKTVNALEASGKMIESLVTLNYHTVDGRKMILDLREKSKDLLTSVADLNSFFAALADRRGEL